MPKDLWVEVPPIPGGHTDVFQCRAENCGAFVRGEEGKQAHDVSFHVCQECGSFLGQRHGYGCDLYLYEEPYRDADGHPVLVTEQDCEEG